LTAFYSRPHAKNMGKGKSQLRLRLLARGKKGESGRGGREAVPLAFQQGRTPGAGILKKEEKGESSAGLSSRGARKRGEKGVIRKMPALKRRDSWGKRKRN